MRVLFLLFLAAFILEAKEASGRLFSEQPQSIVLSNGYIKSYIDDDKKESPHYAHTVLDTRSIDKGYVYCLKTASGCIDDLEHIVDTSLFQFVTVGDSPRSYFFIKKETQKIDVILPVIKGFVQDETLLLELKPVQKLKEEIGETELKVPLIPFKIKVDMQNRKGLSIEIKNLSGSDFIATDIYNTDNFIISKGDDTIRLTDEYATMGFCLTKASLPQDVELVEGEDYFCLIKNKRDKTLSNLKFPRVYRRIQGHLEKEWNYVEVAREKAPMTYPHEILGFEKSLLLIKNGYSLHAFKKGNYVSVEAGPYLESKLKEEEAKLHSLIHSATR